ncbi:MAG: hypothetical protein HOP16_18005 [Acidobacteria bacterium]|nr:hypothetical protein [Acidobacteriota bacterium]
MATNPCSRDQLLELIQQLYAAPGTQDGWTPFLDRLCTSIGGYCAQLLSVDQHGHAGLALSVRADPAARAAYEQHWGAFDP